MSNTLQNQIRETWLDMLKTRGSEQCSSYLKRTTEIVVTPARRFLFWIIQDEERVTETKYCAMGMLVEAAEKVTGKTYLPDRGIPAGGVPKEVGKLANIAGLGCFTEPKKVVRILNEHPEWHLRNSGFPDTWKHGVSVASLNDSGYTFDNIATIIEQVPLVEYIEPSALGPPMHYTLNPSTMLVTVHK